jgi:hypothetical protein
MLINEKLINAHFIAVKNTGSETASTACPANIVAKKSAGDGHTNNLTNHPHGCCRTGSQTELGFAERNS